MLLPIEKIVCLRVISKFQPGEDSFSGEGEAN